MDKSQGRILFLVDVASGNIYCRLSDTAIVIAIYNLLESCK